MTKQDDINILLQSNIAKCSEEIKIITKELKFFKNLLYLLIALIVGSKLISVDSLFVIHP